MTEKQEKSSINPSKCSRFLRMEAGQRIDNYLLAKLKVYQKFDLSYST